MNGFLATQAETDQSSDSDDSSSGTSANGITSDHLRALVALANQRERITIPENERPGDRRRRHAVLVTFPRISAH
ncbi:unnamed protein product [Moneuplotes crassus]|uniref:Uncharacterized protein n=1 Tax=Euplotes crassus TaxID=5936 RepID=A0AAD1XK48_EUPCR|nr:unnamed protein product [Moneuplotes crassus]